MVVQQAQLAQFLIHDVHDMLGDYELLQPLAELLLDGVLVLLLQAQLLLDDLQLLLQEVLAVRLLDFLLDLQGRRLPSDLSAHALVGSRGHHSPDSEETMCARPQLLTS